MSNKKGYSFTLFTLFTFFLFVSLLVGCSNDASKDGNDNQNNNENESKTEGITIVDGKIDPPVTITTIIGEDPTVQFKDGESYSDNVHTRWAREELGVDIDVQWTSPLGDGSYFNRVSFALASGDELPDVFVVSDKNTIDMLIESGYVMDVGEAFDKYASDTWKAAMAEAEPHIWWPYIHDEKIYAIPRINEYAASQSVMWIRQDWLDHLGLEAPTTIDELEEVMDAFANQDPNQTGKNDTIALDISVDNGFTVSPVGNASWIFGMFGAVPEIWYPDEDGQLQYGSVQPEIKDALEKIKEWKEKGYISNEVALHDFNKVAENVASGNVGIVGAAPWFMAWPGSMVLQHNPNGIYQPYPLPVGVDGKVMRTKDEPSTAAIFINKDISEEALQAFFHYQNTLFSAYESDDPFMFSGYQDGYNYVLNDGEAVMVEGGAIDTAKYTLTGTFAVYPSKLLDTNLSILKGEEVTNKDLANFANAGNLVIDESNFIETFSRQALYVLMQQDEIGVPEYFQGAPTATMGRRSELLTRMETEAFIDIIYGRKSLDEFTEFVENWYSSGGEDITKEVNEWYEGVLKVN